MRRQKKLRFDPRPDKESVRKLLRSQIASYFQMKKDGKSEEELLEKETCIMHTVKILEDL